MRREQDRVTFVAEDSTVGYQVLFLFLLFLAAAIVWLWPGPVEQLALPWRRAQWGHLEGLALAALVAIGGALVVVLGGYLSDRGRRHRICFDPSKRKVVVEEWWRGFKVDMEFPFRLFSSFEVHRPVDQKRWWELGAVLNNQSYWRLERSKNRQSLQERAATLNAEMAFEEAESRDCFGDIGDAEDIEVGRGAGKLELQWFERERPATRVCMAVATIFFSLASLLPVVLVFDGHIEWLWGALVVATALFVFPLVMTRDARMAWPFIIAWLAVVVIAIAFLGANWIYFPLATMGVAIFGSSCLELISGLWGGERHSFRIDDEGRLYDEGRAIEEKGDPIRAEELEGALVNITEIRPARMSLVWPGGKEYSLALNLGRKCEGDLAEIGEPIEVKGEGLSLFELIWVSLMVDAEISRRRSG